MHEGKCSAKRSGAEPVSKEELQSDKQTGEQLLNPVWNRTRRIIPETGLRILQNRSRNSSRTGAETAQEQEQKHVPEQDQEQVPETGPGTVFVKEGQGLNQTEGTHAKSCLEQNKPNNPETVTRTNSRTGAETGPQTVPESDSPRNQAGNIGSLQYKKSFISLRGARCDTLYYGWEQDHSLRSSDCSRTRWIKFRTRPDWLFKGTIKKKISP